MISQKNIVLVDFPFSDLVRSKVRPVIVISNDFYNTHFDDLIGVPVTSNLEARDYCIELNNKDLVNGHLITVSKIKVDRVFSFDKNLIRKVIGKVNDKIHQQIIGILNNIIM